MATRNPGSGFAQRFLIHWLTAVLVSVLFSFLLMPFEGTSLYRTLDRSGTDAVMKMYMSSRTRGNQRVVVVDVGREATIQHLAETLGTILLNSTPTAVGVDYIVVADAPDDSVKNLVTVLKDHRPHGTPVALPVINARLNSGIESLSGIRPANADLLRDEDGVVRRTACLDTPQGETLAVAMLGLKAPPGGCKRTPILFAPVQAPSVLPSEPSVPPEQEGVFLVAQENAKNHADMANNSYVLLGQVASGSTADTFMTPVGEMPGVLIHAESVWTLLNPQPWWMDILLKPLFIYKFALDIFVGATAGAILSFYTTCIDLLYDRLEKLYILSFGYEATARRGAAPSVQRILFEFLLRGLGGLILIAAVLMFLGWLWTWFAGGLVQRGLILGALGAVFGAMLEFLAHTGKSLVDPLHLLASWLVRRWIRPALLGLLCLSSVPARAADCSYTLQFGSKTYQISIDGKDYSNLDQSFPPPVHPFERVEAKGVGTSVTLLQEGRTADSAMSLARAAPPDPPAVLIVPPCSPRPGLTGAWYAFWDALNPQHRDLRSAGATPVYRGQEKGSQAVGGVLRELTNLAPATGTVAGTSGLAFAWAGGNAPYHVALEDEASGTSLASTDVAMPNLWLPQWHTPGQPFVIIVRDAKGAELSRHLRPLPPASIGDTELGDAILLFETMPAYRLEALRRLVAQANEGDALAGRAVALLQYTGASR